MTKKTTKKKRMRRETVIKAVKDIFDWTLIIGLVLFSLFYLTPWTDDNVTKVQGIVSNVSTYSPLGGWDAYITFSLNGKDYYYYVSDEFDRKDVQELLQATVDDGLEVIVSVTEKIQWDRVLTFAGKERVVAIEGESVDFPVIFLNRFQQRSRIGVLICAFLLILLKYWPHIVYFLVVRSVEKGKGNKKPIRLPRQKNKNQ